MVLLVKELEAKSTKVNKYFDELKSIALHYKKVREHISMYLAVTERKRERIYSIFSLSDW